MKSWKTFLFGLLTAISVALYPLMYGVSIDLKTDWPRLLLAALIATFGYVAKDANVTGGNTSNGLTPNKPVEPLTKDKPENT